jgi:hypothetical protein
MCLYIYTSLFSFSFWFRSGFGCGSGGKAITHLEDLEVRAPKGALDKFAKHVFCLSTSVSRFPLPFPFRVFVGEKACLVLSCLYLDMAGWNE